MTLLVRKEGLHTGGLIPMQVLIVGSDPAFVRDNLTAKLAGHDVSILEHWDWASRPGSKLPKGCGGVILIVPEATPDLIATAKDLASENGVPFVDITRQFSKALPLLRKQGIVTNGVGQSVSPEEPPTDEQVYETVFVYCRREVKGNGSIPSESRCRGVVKRVYGSATPLRKAVYKRALAAATSAAAIRKVTAEEKALAVEWAALVLDDQPERDDKDIADILAELYNDAGLPREVLLSAAQDARDAFLATMSVHYRKLTQEEVAARAQIKLEWAVRHFVGNVDEDGYLPSYDEVRTVGLDVFGGAPSDKIIKVARDQAIKVLWPDEDPTSEVEDPTSEVEDPTSEVEAFTLPPTPDPAPIWMKHYPVERVEQSIREGLALFAEWSGPHQTLWVVWLAKVDIESADYPVPDEIVARFAVFDGKPVHFAAGCLLVLPEGSGIKQTTVIRAYRLLTGRGTDGNMVNAAAWALGRPLRGRSDLPTAEMVHLAAGYSAPKDATAEIDATTEIDATAEIDQTIDSLFDEDEDEGILTELESANKETDRQRARAADLLAENQRFNTELTTRAKEVNQLNKQVSTMTTDLASARKATRLSAADVERAQAGKTTAELDRSGAIEALEEEKGKTAGLQADLSDSAELQEETQRLLEEKKTRVAGLQSDLREAQSGRGDAQRAYDAEATKATGLAARVEVLEAVNEVLEADKVIEIGEKMEALSTMVELRRENERLASELAEAQVAAIAPAASGSSEGGMTLREAMEMGYDIKLTRPKT